MNFSGQELVLGMTGMLVFVSTIAATLSLVWLRSMGRASRVGQLADAASSGVFLGIGFLHMLPEAVLQFGAAGGDSRLIFLVAGLSLLFLLALDRLGGAGGTRVQVLMVTGVLVIHMFLTGFALGAEETHAAILVLFVALIIHKVAEAFAFGRLLARGPGPGWLSGLLIVLFVGALPLGVLAAMTAVDIGALGQTTVPLILAVASGTFLHFGLNHTHLLGSNVGWQCLGARMGGFALMAGFAFFVGH